VHSRTARGYKGPVRVDVTVKEGQIRQLRVTGNRETRRYFDQAAPRTIQRILQTQGVEGVETVTGATETSRAIIQATAQALKKAMK